MRSKKIERSQAEMGLTSMVSYFQSIAKDETSSNNLLNLFKEDFSNFVKDTKPFFTNAIKIQDYLLKNLSKYKNKILSQIETINNKLSLLLDNAYQKNNSISNKSEEIVNLNNFGNIFEIYLTKISLYLKDILDRIDNFYYHVVNSNSNKENTDIKNSFGNILFKFLDKKINSLLGKTNEITELIKSNKNSFLNEQINNFIILFTENNFILKTIEFLQHKTNKLLDLLLKKDFTKPVDETKKSESSKGQSLFTDLTKGITNFKKVLSKKFLTDFKTFVDLYEKLINDDNSKKLFLIKASLLAFSTTLKLVSIYVSSAKKAFLSFTLTIWLLAFSLINPIFISGTIYLVSFLVTLKKSMGGVRGSFIFVKRLRQLAFGLIAIAGATYVIGKIGWGSVYKLLFFLIALSGVLKLFAKKGPAGPIDVKKSVSKKFEVSGLFGLAVGLAILVMSISMSATLNWGTATALIFFIGSLGLTIFAISKLNKKFGGGVNPFTNMFDFGLGITFIVLALTLVKTITWDSVLKLSAFIGLLGIDIFLFSLLNNKAKIGKSSKMRGLFGLSMGILVLVLSMKVIGTIDWKQAFEFIGFIGLLGLTLGITTRLIKGGKGLFGLSLGLIAMMLAFKLFEKVNFEPLAKSLIFLTGLGVIMRIFKPKVLLSMLLLSVGILTLSGSLFVLSMVKFDWEQMLKIGITIVGLIGIFIFASKFWGKILIGSLTLTILSITTLLLGFSLKLLSTINIDIKQIGIFLLGIGLLTFGFIVLQPLMLTAISGAALGLVLGLASLAIVFPLLLMNQLTFEGVGAFMLGLTALTVGYIALTPMALGATLTAALLIVVGISTMLIAGALMAISELEINEKQIDNFGSCIISLTKAYDKIGLISIGKAVLKSAALLPIIAVSTLAALSFKAIGALKVNPGAMDNFGVILGDFLRVTTTEINNSVGALKAIKPGLSSLSKLVGVAADLVKVIEAFANMKYIEYDIDSNGKLVPKKVHEIDDTKLKSVGKNIGILIQALLNPLAELGSDKKEWDFGGTKVFNPFKGGWFGTDNNSGVNRLKKIGEAFLPISEFVAKWTNLDIVTDSKKLNLFKQAFGNILDTVVSSISKFKDVDEKLFKSVGNNLDKFLGAFGDNIDSEKFNTLDKMLSNIINNLTDDAKWEKINNNLTTLKTQFTDIAKAINTIDIEKATAFERNVKLLVEKNNGENLKETVEQLKELMGIVKVQQESTNKIAESAETTSKSVEKLVAPSNKESKENDFKSVADLLLQAVNVLSEISGNTAGTNSRLNRPLKIIPVEANKNQL